MTSLFDRAGLAYKAFIHAEGKPQEQIGPDKAMLDPDSVYTNISGTPWNPDVLQQRRGQFIYDDMRIDEQCHAALYFKKMAVIAPGFDVQSPDDEDDDWEVTEFIRNQIDSLPGTFEQAILQILSAFDFGFSVTEKTVSPIREGDFSGLIGLDRLTTKYPYPFQFHVDKGGKLVNLSQDGHAENLPLGKFVLYTNFLEFSNYYGRSDLRMAYRAWWTKDNTMRWLGQLLERYGVPPIFLMYDNNVYKDVGILNKLHNTLRKLRSASNALLPRPSRNKDIADPHLEPWAPELASNSRDVFVPVLRVLDQMIARAILMPNLMGFTADEGTGLALTRGKVSFEAFMLVVKYSQKQVAESAMNDQIIRPLCDLNFPNLKKYPTFRFNPILDEQSVQLLEEWRELVSKGVTDHQPQDERHVRSMMNWPDWDEEFAAEQERKEDERLKAMQPGGDEDGGNDPETEERKEQRQLLDNTKPLSRTYELSREPNQFERYVNFEQVNTALNRIEAEGVKAISEVLQAVREKIIQFVGRSPRNLDTRIADLRRLPLTGQIREEVRAILQVSYDTGFSQATEEMARAVKRRKNFQTGPTYVPSDALKFLRKKSLVIADVLSEKVLDEVKLTLMQGIEHGESVPELIDRVRTVFQQYVDDAALIRGDAVLELARLESIVRTNVTDAMNQGRLVSSRRNMEFLNGFEYSAILDARTTDVCRHLDGKIFRKDSPDVGRLKPPRHYNCRSILVPVTIDIPVKPNEYITPGQIGRGLELSGKGF